MALGYRRGDEQVKTHVDLQTLWVCRAFGAHKGESPRDRWLRLEADRGWNVVSRVRPRMSVVRSLWASVQGDPVFMRRVNGWFTVFWVVMIPVSIVTGWISSVTYVAALSLWALVSGHWSAWQAARVEVEQARQEQKKEEEDLPGEIVDRMVSDTDLQPEMG